MCDTMNKMANDEWQMANDERQMANDESANGK